MPTSSTCHIICKSVMNGSSRPAFHPAPGERHCGTACRHLVHHPRACGGQDRRNPEVVLVRVRPVDHPSRHLHRLLEHRLGFVRRHSVRQLTLLHLQPRGGALPCSRQTNPRDNCTGSLSLPHAAETLMGQKRNVLQICHDSRGSSEGSLLQRCPHLRWSHVLCSPALESSVGVGGVLAAVLGVVGAPGPAEAVPGALCWCPRCAAGRCSTTSAGGDGQRCGGGTSGRSPSLVHSRSAMRMGEKERGGEGREGRDRGGAGKGESAVEGERTDAPALQARARRRLALCWSCRGSWRVGLKRSPMRCCRTARCWMGAREAISWFASPPCSSCARKTLLVPAGPSRLRRSSIASRRSPSHLRSLSPEGFPRCGGATGARAALMISGSAGSSRSRLPAPRLVRPSWGTSPSSLLRIPRRQPRAPSSGSTAP